MKTGFYLEAVKSGAMKLHRSTKNMIGKDKNSENVLVQGLVNSVN